MFSKPLSILRRNVAFCIGIAFADWRAEEKERKKGKACYFLFSIRGLCVRSFDAQRCEGERCSAFCLNCSGVWDLLSRQSGMAGKPVWCAGRVPIVLGESGMYSSQPHPPPATSPFPRHLWGWACFKDWSWHHRILKELSIIELLIQVGTCTRPRSPTSLWKHMFAWKPSNQKQSLPGASIGSLLEKGIYLYSRAVRDLWNEIISN